MIIIWLRELSTHNNGYSLDKKFDLDEYSSSSDILEELFTYTKEKIEEIDPENMDYYNFEEWMITDYEFEDSVLFSFKISEYESITKLLEINETFNDLDTDSRIKYTALLERGFGHEQVLDKFDDCIVYSVESSYSAMSDLAYDFVEDGFFGEIADNIKMYIDYEKIGRDLEMNGTFEQVEHDGSTYLVEIN